jgi:hypothetical protein
MIPEEYQDVGVWLGAFPGLSWQEYTATPVSIRRKALAYLDTRARVTEAKRSLNG